MDQKFMKKGQLLKSSSGDLSLVNGSYKSYPVDEDVIDVWSRLDGTKTVKDVASEIGDIRGKSIDEVVPHITLLIKELSGIDLVINA